jgi:hypothetical protein
MSVLNNASDGLHTVLIVLFQSLLDDEVGLAEDTLRQRLEPPGAGGKYNDTLRRWLELGLFEKHGERISVATKCRVPPGHHTPGSLEHVVWAARTTVFAPENNERFWEATQSRAADLTRSLAWLLCQDVYSFGWSTIAELEAVQVTDESKRFARNSNRVSMLRSWGAMLGFLWDDGDSVAIDPTAALLDVLPATLGSAREMPVEDFLRAVAAELPVLDRGRYRAQVEEHLDPAHYPRISAEAVSSALSRALSRLRRNQVVRFENRADSPQAVYLRGPQGRPGDRITHIGAVQG